MTTTGGNTLFIKASFSEKDGIFNLEINEQDTSILTLYGEISDNASAYPMLVFKTQSGQGYQIIIDYSRYDYYDN